MEKLQQMIQSSNLSEVEKKELSAFFSSSSENLDLDSLADDFEENENLFENFCELFFSKKFALEHKHKASWELVLKGEEKLLESLQK